MRDLPPSKLERAAAAAVTAKQPLDAGKLERAAIGARVREPFVIPRLNLPAVMTLIPHDRIALIESELIELMDRKLRIPLNSINEITWECERAARYCAEAVIDPDTINADGSGDWKPIGTLDTWRTKLDPDVLGDCYRIYADVRATYDPIGVGCTQEELDAIAEIVKKKEMPMDTRLQLLRAFGVRRLSSWLVTMGAQLFSSAIPKSSGGESSSASSTTPPSPIVPTLLPSDAT